MKKIILFIFLFLLTISFVSSAPPVTTVQSFAEGYVIEHPPQDYIKQGEDYTLNFFLKNISNGVTIDNTSVTCAFFMQNESGIVILSADVDYNGAYWDLLIGGGNFFTPGIYSYGIDCEGGGIGGAEAKAFEVTPSGDALDTPKGILFGVIIFVIFLLLLFSLIKIFNSDSPAWFIVFTIFSYFLFLILSFLFWIFSENYLYSITWVVEVFYIVFLITLILMFPFIIFLFLYLFYNIFTQQNMQGLMDMGYSPDEAKKYRR